MPRKPLGPRLYLRRDGGKKVWIVRDRNRDTRTGFSEDQRDEAQRFLDDYLNRSGPLPKLPAGVGFIYFVTCMGSPHYPIKIGWSATPPSARLAKLQNGNPNLLTVVATLTGTQRDEQRLHLYFAELHIRGEWFRRDDELIDYIGGLPGYSEAYGDDEFAPNNAHTLRTS